MQSVDLTSGIGAWKTPEWYRVFHQAGRGAEVLATGHGARGNDPGEHHDQERKKRILGPARDQGEIIFPVGDHRTGVAGPSRGG